MAKRKHTSTQKYLAIKEIRDGIVALKNGGYRSILMVNAVNFHLKSQDEQDALQDAYQNFLNGLGFPIQIVVQSRLLDLDAYLKELEAASRQQVNNLLKAQTEDYIGFVRELIGVSNIMSKTFYVIIPYETQPIAQGFLARIFSRGRSTPTTLGRRFEKIKTDLTERISIVSNGLASLGLNNVQLNTQEIVELFYLAYNPDTARRQKLFSVSNVDADIIKHIEEAR